MKRIVTAANGVVFQPDAANDWQDTTVGARAASQTNDLAADACVGGDRIVWQYSGGLVTGTQVLVDDSIDWRDRVLEGRYKDLLVTADALGGADDHNFSNTFPTVFDGYTGTGGLDAGGNDPTNGNPPVLASGKYFVACDGAAKTVLLYAGQTSGKLYLYNNTGGTIRPYISVVAFGDAGFV